MKKTEKFDFESLPLDTQREIIAYLPSDVFDRVSKRLRNVSKEEFTTNLRNERIKEDVFSKFTEE